MHEVHCSPHKGHPQSGMQLLGYAVLLAIRLSSPKLPSYSAQVIHCSCPRPGTKLPHKLK